MIPVNLRNIFPSDSMRNFFGWIDIGYDFATCSNELEDVIAYTSDFFKRELTLKRIGARMDNLIQFEKNPLIRIVPLELKYIFMQLGAKFISVGENTAVFSNIGKINLPYDCESYLDYFEFYTTPPRMELCMCTFQEHMTLSFTSAFVTNRVEENFFSILKELNLDVRMIVSGDSRAGQEHFPDLSKETATHDFWYRLFTFSCLAVMVISGILNYLLIPEMFWSRYVMGGMASAWIITSVGYRKRRNLLKNAVWQLVLIGIGLYLWDYATGFYGWSLNIGLPCLILSCLAAITAIIIFFQTEFCRLYDLYDDYLPGRFFAIDT